MKTKLTWRGWILILGAVYWVASGFKANGMMLNDPYGNKITTHVVTIEAGELSNTSGVNLDSFDVNNWDSSKSPVSSMETSVVSGKMGNAVQIGFDMSLPMQWVMISKEIRLEDTAGKAMKFYVRSQGSGSQNLEVQLVHSDGTTYSNSFPLSLSNQWELVTVRLGDFSYYSSGTKTGNPVTRVQFAVNCQQPGTGIVALDGLRLVTE